MPVSGTVIPGRCEASNLRCAIAHRGSSRFRVRIFDAPRNDGDSNAHLAGSNHDDTDRGFRIRRRYQRQGRRKPEGRLHRHLCRLYQTIWRELCAGVGAVGEFAQTVAEGRGVRRVRLGRLAGPHPRTTASPLLLEEPRSGVSKDGHGPHDSRRRYAPPHHEELMVATKLIPRRAQAYSSNPTCDKMARRANHQKPVQPSAEK